MSNPTAYAATVAKHPRIEGVKTKALRIIPDERGYLMEMLRSDEGDTLERRSVDVEPNSGGPNALRMPLRKTHKTDGRPPFECIALLLQGGGTLGAYQAGVYEALDQRF